MTHQKRGETAAGSFQALSSLRRATQAFSTRRGKEAFLSQISKTSSATFQLSVYISESSPQLRRTKTAKEE